MVLKAAELLENEGATGVTRGILSFISILDDWGALTVNQYGLAVGTFVVLVTIKIVCGKSRGVDWYAFVHGCIAGIGNAMACYLDVFASEALTGVPEPLRACQCQGPLTSLHRILPAITLGYSVLDLFDGLFLGVEFALHGAALFFSLIFYIWTDSSHLAIGALVSEMSTINLVRIRAHF